MENRIVTMGISIVCLAFVLTGMAVPAGAQDLTINNLTLGYPVPGIPFYHFRADLELPHPSIIEVEAAVDGRVLRSTDLYKAGQIGDINRPPLTHRPPSGYGLALDGTEYSAPTVVGWVKWEPGIEYDIQLTVRLKEIPQGSEDDKYLSVSRTVRAPEGVAVFDPAWKSYKSVVLSETVGIDRTDEPVEVVLAFYPDEAHDLKREIRVAAVDPNTHELSEVPSQVYDIMKNLEEDDLAPGADGVPTRNVPLWLPTVTARIAFLADVPARSSRVFLVYYNNTDAMANWYQTDLRVQGDQPGLQINNDRFTAILHPDSGHLDQITLNSRPDVPLYHRMETNGAIHWNPGVYVPPRPWTHTADWKPPGHMSAVIGPVISTSEAWDHLRGVPEVDASVRYSFYPGVPYFLSTTTMRINETVANLALRNAEIVFKRELMSHVAWYDAVRDSIITYNVKDMPDLTDVKMEADLPWITFYDESSGIGFAGIQLSYVNAGLESRPRLLNPNFYVTGGPWIYWSRALSLSFLSSNMQQPIPAPGGTFYTEKWAYLMYEYDRSDRVFTEVQEWRERLIHPLRIHLVEEVDDRVSRTVEEVYMDEGRSGWEGRETGRHD